MFPDALDTGTDNSLRVFFALVGLSGLRFRAPLHGIDLPDMVMRAIDRHVQTIRADGKALAPPA